MYKLLLCWRYLLTRYLALACIISVMLGVATLIVVNSVMGGFSTKLRDRLHGLLSDVVIEATSLEGFANPKWHMDKIRQDPFLKDRVVAMSPTMEVFAMLQFRIHNGELMTRTVRLIGIDPETRTELGGFKEHLIHQKDRDIPSFEPSEKAKQWYQMRNQFALPPQQQQAKLPLSFFPDPGPIEPQNESPVFPNLDPMPKKAALLPPVIDDSPPDLPPAPIAPAERPPGKETSKLPDLPPGIDPVKLPPAVAPAKGKFPPPTAPPPSKPKVPHGVIVGNLIASIRLKGQDKDELCEEHYLLYPGDEIILTTVRGGKLAPAYDHFLVVDYFKSQMSEYDSNYVFVPLDYLQELRCMEDRVTSIQIKLKNYDRDKEAVLDRLRELFPALAGYHIDTWEGKQGPLLAAIQIEKGILNVLLFLIIAVAGFGILAIFSMIVTEKTRDIGIMKALGGSNRGVMAIFLSYGLLLGLVGAGLGTLLGVTMSIHINEVERFLSQVTGQDVFDRSVYYFNEIPTQIDILSIALLNLGAIGIAIFFSVVPALRAAWLHPVRALRYE